MRPELLVVFAALLWSAGGLGVKACALGAMQVAGLRGAFAALAMLLLTRWYPGWSVAELRRALARPWVLAAAVAYAAMVVCFVASAKLTTAANAILIQYTAPLYVVVVGWRLLGEKPRAQDLVAVVGCLLGLLLCVGSDRSGLGGARLGNLLAVVSSLGFAALPLCLRADQRALQRRHADERPEVAAMVAMIAGNLLASSTLLLDVGALAQIDARELAITGALGVFQIAVPYVLYGMAVGRMSALKSSLLAFVEPVLTPVWVYAGLGERPSRGAILGGAVILAALSVQAMRRAPRAPVEPAATH